MRPAGTPSPARYCPDVPMWRHQQGQCPGSAPGQLQLQAHLVHSASSKCVGPRAACDWRRSGMSVARTLSSSGRSMCLASTPGSTARATFCMALFWAAASCSSRKGFWKRGVRKLGLRQSQDLLLLHGI